MKIPGIKNIGTLYQDDKGNTWLLKKEALPKKKGYYFYWTAVVVNDFALGDQEFKEEMKRSLLDKIANSK